MLVQKFALSVIKNSYIRKQLINHFQNIKTIQNSLKFTFSQSQKADNIKNQSQLVTYVPIRPLKKYLTPLYVQKNYLNKGKITKRIPFWPYMTPFYAIVVNNFLTSWNMVNTTIASVLFLAGILLRQSPNKRRQRQVVKFECNQDMSKLYMTINYSLRSKYMSTIYPNSYKGFQDWNVFDDEQLKSKEYIPTQADKKSFTQEQLKQKQAQFDKKLVQKILKERNLETSINRFELDTSKTLFKLANNYLETIKDHEVLHPAFQIKASQMLNVPYKYLIVRTEFTHKKINKPYHFFLDLEENGDLKYQDYLVAMGANYKISLASESK